MEARYQDWTIRVTDMQEYDLDVMEEIDLGEVKQSPDLLEPYKPTPPFDPSTSWSFGKSEGFEVRYRDWKYLVSKLEECDLDVMEPIDFGGTRKSPDLVRDKPTPLFNPSTSSLYRKNSNSKKESNTQGTSGLHIEKTDADIPQKGWIRRCITRIRMFLSCLPCYRPRRRHTTEVDISLDFWDRSAGNKSIKSKVNPVIHSTRF